VNENNLPIRRDEHTDDRQQHLSLYGGKKNTGYGHSFGKDEGTLIQEIEEVNDTGNPESQEVSASLEDLEKDMIRKALTQTGGNRRQTAARLGISERTLYRKIKEYGLEQP
ncbi:MAG: hypothetical protein IJY00_04235, partial [Bacteroidaceae bacterium]|nr:hypothetical protein [Bacteroidaceae bacterium]